MGPLKYSKTPDYNSLLVLVSGCKLRCLMHAVLLLITLCKHIHLNTSEWIHASIYS